MLRSVFLDMHLAFEAGQGAPWAYLDSAGTPFPDPLNVVSYSVKCASFLLLVTHIFVLALSKIFLLLWTWHVLESIERPILCRGTHVGANCVAVINRIRSVSYA